MLVFIARAALGGGPNLVCTVLMLTLAAHVSLNRPLGRRLHLQLDNTTSENKNKTVLGFVAMLVAWRVFEDATVFFLPVGHTYNELDAAFSPLITAVMQTVIASVSALVAVIELALATKRVKKVVNLPHLWNFSTYLSAYMHDIGGFTNTQQSSGMHEFYFSKDPEGQVRMLCRQSSQASTWLPEGDGDLVFKEAPNPAVVPPIAPIQRDSEWGRTAVAVNVRRWLPYLGLRLSQQQEAELEWEDIFSKLPLDGDISQIRDPLEWPALPVRSVNVTHQTGQSEMRRTLLLTRQSARANPTHVSLECQVPRQLLQTWWRTHGSTPSQVLIAHRLPCKQNLGFTTTKCAELLASHQSSRATIFSSLFQRRECSWVAWPMHRMEVH